MNDSQGLVFGYARVSTVDQNLDTQIEKLKQSGCQRIFSEKVSGKDTNRPELQMLLGQLRKGDTVIVTKIDRIARNLKDLLILVDELSEQGVNFKATDQDVDTSSSNGKMFLTMLGVFAEFERNLIRERQREGIANAKKQGKYTGRKPVDPKVKQQVIELYSNGVKPKAIIEETGLGRSTVFKIIKEG
ncbi:recombinase family protein [Pseudoalteromonas sp. JC28]|uniref:recombinase family protein n=1 Tax=Pseudoalteromonas sp. JC28 TaxID=2267617 RepID=UPI001573C018|nr:recombinase family protein [Pseudoalteromonas sp. JC28]NSY33366.1 recombinase family protein [Pseudoalteromonas sp. JC28]